MQMHSRSFLDRVASEIRNSQNRCSVLSRHEEVTRSCDHCTLYDDDLLFLTLFLLIVYIVVAAAVYILRIMAYATYHAKTNHRTHIARLMCR